jgi:hypothetical protein
MLGTFSSILFYIFIGITAVAIFVPLKPKMPGKGFDLSWEFAMNVAVAQHLSFGKDIIFSYGPYASIITHTYDPTTDRRMMYGSLLVGMSYITALLFLVRGRNKYLLVVLLLFMATFVAEELLLLSYSFLLMACLLKQANTSASDRSALFGWGKALAVLVMWSALGLCVLVKGTLLLPVATFVAISSCFLVYSGRFRMATILFLIPLAATAALWSAAGQSLGNFPAFLYSTLSFISGYTEAMAVTWSVLPSIIGNGLVLASVVVFAAAVFSVARTAHLTIASKWALIILFAVSMLVAFKHAFVQVSNMPGVFSFLTLYILIVGLLYTDKYLMVSLIVATTLTVITSVCNDSVLYQEVHNNFGVGITWSGEQRSDVFAFCLKRAPEAYCRTTFLSTWNTYRRAWAGLCIRAGRDNGLEHQYVEAVANMRRSYAVPLLNGGVDLYTNDQSALLSSDNEWNPRPMFQSFESFTPFLARVNEQHLRGLDAPGWVLFELETMDDHLPSLDDGMSWPALLDNYTFVTYDGSFVIMQKKHVTHATSSYDDVYRETCKTGATVALPETDGLLFAEVDLKPTLLGRLLIAFYKPPQLYIDLGLGDGTSRRYRVISNMMTTGFVVSPLVRNTEEFASLMDRPKRLLKEKQVKSISIVPSYGGSVFWSDTYALTVKRYLRE